MASDIPSSKTCTRHAAALGKAARNEYWNLREKLKGEGLSPREAIERSYVELKIGARWLDQQHRIRTKKAFGDGSALTPDEMSEVHPEYSPVRAAQAEQIGDEDLSLQEQVKWAMKWVAKVQNGADPPKKFPNEGALFWYQSAVGNRRDFERLLLKVESPGNDPDNLYLQDSQYQFHELEKQIQRAVDEVGPRLKEVEKKYLDKVEAAD